MTEPLEPTGTSGKNEDSPSPPERGSFLGFVAHEMRNPLSTALWSAELLARLSPEERAGPRGEKLSGMCLRSMQRLRLLIEDHFLAERLAVAGMPIRLEAIPLREAVEAILPKTGVTALQMGLPAGLTGYADRALLDRALEGLLAVAGKGGIAVSVTGDRTGDVVTIRLQGAPLAEDALEPPQKGTASDPSGRALALYMAREVARTLGGELSLEHGALVLTMPAPTSATPPPVTEAP